MQHAEASPPAPAAARAEDRAVAYWLLACCALVLAMVVVGGITRLTHSGLSIVEWQPIVGALPPLDDAGWQETFGKYKQTPEYRLVNPRSEEHTSELQSPCNLVCRLLLEKKKK